MIHKFIVWGDPIGAPRMTQSDKWKKRPCVVRYRAWKDAARKAAGELPPVDKIVSLNWTAYFSPPVSWSGKRRSAALGTLHRSKPDLDNICKAVFDSLFEQDQAIAHGTFRKEWDVVERLEVEIITVD